MGKTLVADVYNLHGNFTPKMDVETPLEEAIELLVDNPSANMIFLIDSKQRFIDAVRMSDLLRWASVKVAGIKGNHTMPAGEILKLIDAAKIGDLRSGYKKSLSIKESDTLQAALKNMLYIEEHIFAVLDNDGKVLGDLRLSECLSWIINNRVTTHV
ncbi:MAG: hypothetical protein PHI59_08005 [Candidatus Omnitrophica bacterium]|nr:hypothetical protein [Candidatus Omnitrophota bacterium]